MTRKICDCVCINHPFSAKVEFSAGAKVVDTLPFYAYISKSENPNNFIVERLNKKLKTPAYSVYKSLFNGVLISEFIKCAIWMVYANMVTYFKVVGRYDHASIAQECFPPPPTLGDGVLSV